MNPEPQREWMINHQVRPWSVFDDRVLAALAAVKREQFVPERFHDLAFADTEIPLACGQFMLKPVLEGRMLQALDTHEDNTALLIGTGSGYLAACLARLTRHVTSIDLHDELTDAARDCMTAERIRNVELASADFVTVDPGTSYDRIIVTGSLPQFDPRLAGWLNPGGKLILVTGDAPSMAVEEVTRSEAHFQRRTLFETVIRPLEHVQHRPEFQF